MMDWMFKIALLLDMEFSRLYYALASMPEMNCSSTTWKQQGKMHYTLANEMIVTGGEIIRRKIIANREIMKLNSLVP